jgi:hypothetical protein
MDTRHHAEGWGIDVSKLVMLNRGVGGGEGHD